jgi:hypothetical protein
MSRCAWTGRRIFGFRRCFQPYFQTTGTQTASRLLWQRAMWKVNTPTVSFGTARHRGATIRTERFQRILHLTSNRQGSLRLSRKLATAVQPFRGNDEDFCTCFNASCVSYSSFMRSSSSVARSRRVSGCERFG